jgi:ATP-dependent phosphofructokinase / diphosphate-dependent phosphofructokinase
MKVGVLTGGGDCAGLNAVIRAFTKSLIAQAGAEVIGIEQGFLGLIERRSRPLRWADVSGISGRGGTVLGTHNRADPFAFFGAAGADVSAAALAYARDELALDALVVIGGDGSMAIADRFARLGLPIVGVPKTIDNDLHHNDRSFGFDTAVAVVTDALGRLETTGQSHGRVMILETMGRYAGWIALEAGLAGAADVILLPELPYSLDAVVARCREREQRHRLTLICIAEGAAPVGGAMTVAEPVASAPQPIRLGGVAQVLRAQLQPRIDSEVRATVLGHVQRGGAPTPFDRVLATQFGIQAVAMLRRGEFGRMATLRGGVLGSVELAAVAGRNRRVPQDHALLDCARQTGVCLG